MLTLFSDISFTAGMGNYNTKNVYFKINTERFYKGHYKKFTLSPFQKHPIILFRWCCWCSDCRGSQRSDGNNSPTSGQGMSGLCVPVYFMRGHIKSQLKGERGERILKRDNIMVS